ncbi:hypothetical protein DL765_005898 [Monosporascus sp. GIB2]|nr:hypothetical protein DL765_005898 [Monosporascus sp. GIB2]
MDSSNREASGSRETAVGSGIAQGTRDTATAQGGLSRLLRLRTAGLGSRHARRSSVDSLDRVFDTRTDSKEPRVVPLQRVLTAEEERIAKNSYGVTELRDSFFDAVFFPPEEADTDELLKRAEATLPYAFRKKDPLSVTNFLPKQWHEVQGVVQRVTTTRAGIKLLKSFLGFFVAYILCLIPQIQSWLGRYNHVMVVSAIINHSGRTLGAHVDGVIMTTIGTATGLGWGAIGLLLSTVSSAARLGYGAILSTFLFVYIFAVSCIRSYYIRTYQLVICAGIAISYICLADVSGSSVRWSNLLDYFIPWVLGQVIALVICAIVAPDAGARPLAVALHQAFGVMLDGLDVNGPDIVRTRRRLAQMFVNLSQAYRDLVIDFSITRFRPQDVRDLRNRTQGVVRTLLSLKSGTRVFEVAEVSDMNTTSGRRTVSDDFVADIDERSRTKEVAGEWEVMKFVASALAEPTEDLLSAMRRALQSCDAVLMEMCGHRQYLGPPAEVPADVSGSLVSLRQRIIAFSSCQDNVLASDKLPPTYADFPERSGLVGCLSFTLVSIAEYNAGGRPSPAMIAVYRGAAMVVGVVASIVVNWVLWPFVARHDLRKGISAMMFYCSIIYRRDEPTKEDIEASEALEGCLREGFVRLRQLLGLTRHEIRLRAPFDPLPYSALIDSCEQFFEYVVTLRQSSLFYHPHFVRDNAEAAAELLSHRRDAIATILTNLYVLSGALRADRKVPKYLPSAAATRKRLLDRTKQLEAELAASGKLTATEKTESRKWAQIYSYSYNESLTGCVEQLLELERYTKAIVGEQG